MTESKYNCIRPECHYDMKSFDYYRGFVSPEQFFIQEEIVYDYFEDYDKWKHVEAYPYYPMIGPGNAVPAVTDLTKKFNGYGFGYSSNIGVGNALNNWYSHTELDVEIMKKIIEDIRGPIIEKIKEAKEAEDKYKQWQIYKKLVEEEVEGVVGPTGEEVTCSHVKEKINAIPLECELIEEVLGAEWSGCDLNNYWWYGWLPTEWLDKDFSNINDRVPFGGTTGDVPTPYTQYSAATPPYQSVIGAYRCPDIEIDDEGVIKIENPQSPWFGSFGGHTADPCGCIDGIENKIIKPHYIEKCNFPHHGKRYPEYLEYIRSIDARYWNTPLKTPLLRNAQLELLKSQQIQITVASNSDLRIGDVVELKFPPSVSTDDIDTEDIHQLNGKWLVSAMKHSFGSSMVAISIITLMRDSQVKEQ